MSEVFDTALIKACMQTVHDHRCLLQTIRSREQVLYLFRLFSRDVLLNTGFPQGDAFRFLMQAAEEKEPFLVEISHLF